MIEKQLAPKVRVDEENKCIYITTSQFRVSFPKLVNAMAMEEGGKKKFSLSMLFPKKHDRKYLNDAVNKVAAMQWGNKLPKNMTKPFKDGDVVEYDGYAGMMVMSGSSSEDYPIQTLGRDKQPCPPSEIYAGCWARASITIKSYEFEKIKKGVTVYVQGVQKLSDDEEFGGRDVSEDFGDDLPDEDFSSGEESSEEETQDW